MGSAEVEAFLNMLANERQISSSTHNQALSAILFLYREVLAAYFGECDRSFRRIVTGGLKDDFSAVSAT